MKNKTLAKTLQLFSTSAGASLVVAVMLASPALALSVTSQTTRVPVTTTLSTERLENLRTRGENEITRRIASLNKLITKISTLKRVADSDKNQFTSDIQTEITSLTTLQTKIKADTDFATLRTDVDSVVNSYRIYAVYMPKITIEAAVDAQATAVDALNVMAPKLLIKINEAKSKGKEVTAINTYYFDLINQIAIAQTAFRSGESAVKDLSPEGYPGNKTQIEVGRQYLKSSYEAIKKARQDVKDIISGLKSLGTSTSVTMTITP